VSAAIDPPAVLLSVRDLSVVYATDGGAVRALDRVSFDVGRGRTVALVGESGSGKSSIASAIMRLLPDPGGSIERGEILFEGRDLRALSEREMRGVRGGRIGMIFQEPMTALDPVYSIGAQIGEALRLHRPISRAEARRRAIELLGRVGYPEPARRIDDYPHELSGGMRQRVLIAIALACDPALLVADEPTSSLDVTIQAQIIDLLTRLKAELGMSLLLIAHDLAVVAEIADEIVVLYAGQVVERGRAAEVLRAPRHPYTTALMKSIPPSEGPQRRLGQKGPRLPTIEGAAPDLRDPPLGCRFHARCPQVFERCRREAPELFTPAPDAAVRCFLFSPDADPSAVEAIAAETEAPILLSIRPRPPPDPGETP
jgi:oligopeptide/dipeptide ABC transporter ATP-binding protein